MRLWTSKRLVKMNDALASRRTDWVFICFALHRMLLVGRGADLAALAREAGLAVLRERMESNTGTEDSSVPSLCVSQKHFEIAFSKIKPSVSSKVSCFINILLAL